MKRTQKIDKPDGSLEVGGRYLSQARYLKRKMVVAQPPQLPTFERESTFKISQLLSELKRSTFRERYVSDRPTTSRRSSKNKSNSATRESAKKESLSDRRSLEDRQRDQQQIALIEKKRKSMSSPNSRYKAPLENTEQCLEYQISNLTKDKISGKRVYQASIRKLDLTDFKLNDPSTRAERMVLNRPYVPRKSISNPPQLQISKPAEASLKVETQGFNNIRYSYRTRKGHVPSNLGKPNQDSYLLFPHIRNRNEHFFGVCDGHGSLGHHVSSFVRLTIGSLLKVPRSPSVSLKQHLQQLYELIMERLLKQSGIDLSYSGTTSVGCYLDADKVFCANIGDSRAIIGRKTDSAWSAVQLSTDHKPNVPEQAQRIAQNGGRVDSYRDKNSNYLSNIENPVGPQRVWLQHQQIPGLAMTRSLGDMVAASVGVSCLPEITEYSLTPNDRFLLVATDGIWQFLRNQQIADKVGSFCQKQQLQEACEWLVGAGVSSWKRECSVVDDITFILVFFGS